MGSFKHNMRRFKPNKTNHAYIKIKPHTYHLFFYIIYAVVGEIGYGKILFKRSWYTVIRQKSIKIQDLYILEA